MRDVTVTLIDDLDHTKADETVTFALDGREYELDLSKAHANELRKMAGRYIAVARRARTAVLHRTPRRTQADRERARQMRAWAVSRGMMTSERGRIPEHVRHEWEAAHRGTAAPSRASAAPSRAATAAKSARADQPKSRKSAARRTRPRRPSGRAAENSRTAAKGQRGRAKK